VAPHQRQPRRVKQRSTVSDPPGFGAVIVWCEAFGQFITAAELRPR
jgi:hypothetical protein